jgi:hypothetical protein
MDRFRVIISVFHWVWVWRTVVFARLMDFLKLSRKRSISMFCPQADVFGDTHPAQLIFESVRGVGYAVDRPVQRMVYTGNRCLAIAIGTGRLISFAHTIS